LETIRSANRLVVAAFDRASTAVVLAASFAVGTSLGAVGRVWMRFVTTREEFSWSGTLFIVVGFGVAFAGQAGVYLARRNRTSRRAFIGLRVLALVTLLPLSFGAGALGFPVIVLAPLAVIRTGWNRWLRILLGVLALSAVVGVAANLFSDLDLTRAAVGSVWFGAIYAVLVWAVCFSFAAQDDQRFTQNIPDPDPEGATSTPRP
jgi:hypothetical protein